MLATTASGFKGAPVTRRWIYFSVFLPVFVGLMETQYMFDVAVSPHLTAWFQWWRVPLNQLAYTSQSQVLMSGILIYNLRVLERITGSRKFLSLLLVTFAYSMVLTPVCLFILHHIPLVGGLNYIPPGQNMAIFALLQLYSSLIPAVYRFQLTPVRSNDEVKLQMSDKAFLYLVAAQLVIGSTSSMGGSLMTAGLGWLVGGLVYSGVLPGKHWRVPFYSRMGIEDVDDNHRARRENENENGNENEDEAS